MCIRDRVLRRKLGSRNGFVRFGNFRMLRSLSPHGVLNSGHKLTVTYYGEITIEPFLNPEFDVDHDFEVKNGSVSYTHLTLPTTASGKVMKREIRRALLSGEAQPWLVGVAPSPTPQTRHQPATHS